MILHSIKSIIRTPKKTVLFLFLIALLSMLLSIGTGMHQSAYNMLKEADGTFSTVVELSYLGDKGNNEEAFYIEMSKNVADFDFKKLDEHPDVISVNKENTAFAYIEGKTINQNQSAVNSHVIIEVFNVQQHDEMYFRATINRVLFGKNIKENTYVFIKAMNDNDTSLGFDFIQGQKYLIIGKKSRGKNPTPIITPGLPEGMEGFDIVVDVKENPEYYDSEDGAKLLKLKDTLEIVNNSLPVTMVTSLEACEPYFNRDILIREGRIFKEEEYQEGKNEVIMISKTLADFYEIKPGDKLNMSLHYAKSGLGLSDYLKDQTFSNVADYEVVGVFEDKYESKLMIYMPKADWLDQDYHSVTLARYLVKNATANKFIEDNKKNLPINMTFTKYDQGYEEAIKPIRELMDIAVLLLVLGALSGIVILLLFAYLYVYKQRDTLVYMINLGAGKRRTLSYILFASLLLVILASTLGSFSSFVFIEKLTNDLYDKMIVLRSSDMRYSERAIGIQMKYFTEANVSKWLPLVTVIFILILSMMLLYGITVYILNERSLISNKAKTGKTKKGKKVFRIKTVKVTKEKNILFGPLRPIPLKYALVSIIRNRARSFIIPLLSLILSVFLVFLTFISNSQEEKRATVYDRIPVNAYITSFKNETRDLGDLSLQYDVYRLLDPEYDNRLGSNLNVYEDYMIYGEYSSLQAQEERNKLLEDSEFFKDMYLYSGVFYEYMGVAQSKDGVENKELSDFPHIRKHTLIEGYDWFLEAIIRMQRLAYADDIRYTPDFFGDPSARVDFLTGYSYDSLKLRENIGIIGDKFAATNGIELGDTIRITAWYTFYDYAVCCLLDLKVVGIYEQTWRSDVIYLPWLMSYDHNYYMDFFFPENHRNIPAERYTGLWNEIIPRSVRSATFTLKNTENLDSFRDYLKKLNYSEAGNIRSNRRAVVIQDKNLMETINTLDNYIRLMDILIPIMLILFGVIGFMISYLLIRHRLNELAIMRSMGAGKITVFLSFFSEQMVLFALGLLPVILFGLVFPEYFAFYRASLGYYIISYLAGTALALVILGRAKLLDILSNKE